MPRDVGSRFGLGDAVRNPGPKCRHVGEPSITLLGRCVAHQQGRDQLDQSALIGHRGISPRELLHHERIGERVEARPAHLLGHLDAEEPELGHLRVQIGWEPLVAVQVLRHRPDHLVGEAAGHVADLRVGFREVHHPSMSNCTVTTYMATPRIVNGLRISCLLRDLSVSCI